jgi:transcriptional regulator GlxA family with amidase domain
MEIQANVPKECWMRRLELPIPGREALNSMFDDLGSPAALMRKEGQCLLLVGHAIEELSKPTRASAAQVADLLVARACALMSERLSEHLALDDLAQGLAVSHATLNRAFKNALGRTVFEELRHMRLERADTLVRQSDLSLSQVAYDCGFSSPAHMSTAFRKRFGATPKERRNGQEQIPE